MRASRWTAALMPIALAAAVLLSGCATFRASRRIEVGPFSENTTGMVSEMQKFNRPPVWTHLRKYQDAPSVIRVRKAVVPVRDVLRGVGLYSAQVVTLYNSPLSDERKVAELARYMEEFIRPGLDPADSSRTGFNQAQLDAVIADIRTRKTLLDALGAAEPLVNATVARGNILFDRVDSLVQVAAADIGDRVEAEYAPLKARIGELDAMHIASVRSYAQLLRYRGGDDSALDSLRVDDPGVVALLGTGRRPAPKDLDAAERFVIDRSTTIKSLRDQLDPEFEIYKESQAELEMLRNQTDERARLGRIALLVWGRSHRNLAAGISVPPMIDVVGVMKSTISTGAGKLVP